MDAKRFADEAQLVLEEELDPSLVRSIKTFEEVGMLTREAGLVVAMQDGSEFQVTIVQSKAARSRDEFTTDERRKRMKCKCDTESAPCDEYDPPRDLAPDEMLVCGDCHHEKLCHAPEAINPPKQS